MDKARVDGPALFRHLKRIQLALRILNAATIVGLIFLGLALREAFDDQHQSFVFIAVLFVVCVLTALGVIFYLQRSRCPNYDSAFSWRWTQGYSLKDDKAGRCNDCGIRINVSHL